MRSKFSGWISRGRPRGYPGGRPGAKTSVRPSKSWKNKHFGADIHDPKARTSMTPRGFLKLRSEKNFGTWWTFRIFFIFFLLGEGGKGESEAPGGGGCRFFNGKSRRGGGGFQEGEGGGEGPGACLRRIGEFGGGG